MREPIAEGKISILHERMASAYQHFPISYHVATEATCRRRIQKREI